MNPEEFKNRTKGLALRVMRLVDSLPKSYMGKIFGRQLLRSGTSVGANYRAACLARSKAEFRAKMGIVAEECDEVIYWLELLTEGGLISHDRISDLSNEAKEILAMVISSIKTARKKK